MKKSLLILSMILVGYHSIGQSGHFDGAWCPVAGSWAKDASGNATTVDIYIDGTKIESNFAPNYNRPDVGGMFGYNYTYPDCYLNGQNHTIDIKYANTNTSLPGSGATFNCSGGSGQPCGGTPPTGTCTGCTGHFDGAWCPVAGSWAKDASGNATTVDIYIDGNKVESNFAPNYNRPDVGGMFGYNYTYPSTYTNGQNHTIDIKYANTNTSLPGSGATFNCSGGGSTPPSNGMVLLEIPELDITQDFSEIRLANSGMETPDNSKLNIKIATHSITGNLTNIANNNLSKVEYKLIAANGEVLVWVQQKGGVATGNPTRGNNHPEKRYISSLNHDCNIYITPQALTLWMKNTGPTSIIAELYHPDSNHPGPLSIVNQKLYAGQEQTFSYAANDLTSNSEWNALKINCNNLASDVGNTRIAVAELTSEKITEEQNAMLLYPNPTNDEVMVSFFVDKNITASIKMADNIGRQVFQKEILGKGETHNEKVSLKNLSVGEYIIQVNDGKRMINKKVVKQ